MQIRLLAVTKNIPDIVGRIVVHRNTLWARNVKKQDPERYRKTIVEPAIEYQKKHKRSVHLKYVGVCICPKCGKKGYKIHQGKLNTKTRTVTAWTVVMHQHYVYVGHGKMKTIRDKGCYIGMGKL